MDDPARPSGGNTYDRRVCAGLADRGWDVQEHLASRCSLAGVLADLAEDSLVLVDGLVASAGAIVPAAARLDIVVLLHSAVGGGGEAEVLAAAWAVVVTSRWQRDQLAGATTPVHVAEPGAERGDLATGSGDGNALLCVAAVAPHKGHDVLLDALAMIEDLPWRLDIVGSLERDRAFAAGLRAQAGGLGDRIAFHGALTGADLDAAYRRADLLVHPTRGETYGMVVTEALAHGLPVLASDVGGVPEALGRTRAGQRPGILVPADDAAALAAALHGFLTDAGARAALRRAARERRDDLLGWDVTSALVEAALLDARRR